MRARRIAAVLVLTALFSGGVWTGLGGAGPDATPGGTTLSLTAKLDAAQEVPKPRAGAGARGTFAAGLVRSGARASLSWRLTFQGLSGGASASHIHLGKRGTAGAVAVPLCGPCRSGARGTARLNAKTVTALLGGGDPPKPPPPAAAPGDDAGGRHDALRGPVPEDPSPPLGRGRLSTIH